MSKKKTDEKEEKEVKKTTKKAAASKPAKTSESKADSAVKAEKKPAAKKKTTKSAPKAEPKAAAKSKSEDIKPKDSSVKQDKNNDAEPKPQPAAKAKEEAPTPSPKTNPSVKYSDEDLQEFYDNIKLSKDDALDELRMLKERLEDLTSPDMAEESMIYSMHMAEQGSEAIEKEKTYAQIQRINEYLKKLDDALNRIKDKTYGICRVCGCLINKERLLAVPITTLSASYKIHQNSKFSFFIVYDYVIF